MYRSSECAYRRRNGYCLLRREACCCNGTCQACSDRLIPVSEALHLRMENWWRTARDLSTKEKRFHFQTRKADGYAVFRTCKGKHRFRDFNEAMRRANELHRRKGLVLAVYECPFCGGYHLTRQLRPYLLRVQDPRSVFLVEVA